MPRYYILPFLLLLVSACAPASPQPQAAPFLIQMTTEGEGNFMSLDRSDGKANFIIRSESGIGGADIARQGGAWPNEVSLQYNLSGLEEMRLDYDGKTIIVSISSLGGNEVSQSMIQDGTEEVIMSDSPYWMDVQIVNADGSSGTIPLTEGSIRLQMPADFVEAPSASFAISWIDFFR